MYLAYVFSIMLAIGAAISGVTTAQLSQYTSKIDAETFTGDMLGYRRAIIDFNTANPLFTGTVSSAQMAPYLLWGDSITTVGLNNVITANNLYVWYTGTATTSQASLLLKKLGGSLLVGYKRSGNLWTIHNQTTDTGIALPATIPDNALVIVGA